MPVPEFLTTKFGNPELRGTTWSPASASRGFNPTSKSEFWPATAVPPQHMVAPATRNSVTGLYLCSFLAMQSVSGSYALQRGISHLRSSCAVEILCFVPSSGGVDCFGGRRTKAICPSSPRHSFLARSLQLGRSGNVRSIGDGYPRSTLMSTKNVPQVTLDWEHGTHVGEYSDYIDVRAPCEFEEDHIPGAINLPVLSDEERVSVGTLYKANPFEARRLGAGLVAKNLNRILESHFADKGKDYRPLVYCWRGGQRSGSLSRVLAEIGYRTSVLQGGYKTYRTDVMEYLVSEPSKFTFNVVSGPTGSCKTRLLQRMDARGLQVLDLEDLAQHRGSILGELGEQPSQKWFESLIALKLRSFDPSQVVWVEAESNNIGKRCMPPGVMDQMQRGVRYHLQVPLHQRVKGLLEDYEHLGVDTETLRGMMKKLARYHSKAQVAEWAEMVDRHDGAALVESLLLNHYDPTYQRSHQKLSSKHEPNRIHVEMDGIGPAELDAAIDFCLSSPPELPSDVLAPEQATDAGPAGDKAKDRTAPEPEARV